MSSRLKSATGSPPSELQPNSTPLQSPAFGSRWRGALARSRLMRALSRPWAGLATCLMYHRICPDQAGSDDMARGFAPNLDLSVTAGAFDEQMAFAARHFNCLSLPEAIEQLAAGTLPKRSLIVTFDDGYLDNLTLALPILRRHAVPATVYIATGLIEQAELPWWYELEDLIAGADGFHIHWDNQHLHFSTIDADAKRRTFDILNPMLKRMDSAEQIRFMGLLRQSSRQPVEKDNQFMNHRQLIELASDPLITIGAHTHHHLALSELKPIRLRHEITHSKELLENWLKQPIEHLAYPFGGEAHAATREFSVAEELGFSSAVTTRLGHFQVFHKNHLLALPRIGIGYQDCMARFEWKLSGLYSMVRAPTSRWTC
ncbi:polysaccharide deacetylase family protein [Wenzhouxiangella sp. AB-CW3]|uniref:polysaccharide deacetylase family protein n=1 Tax=Wenzhouxiangella sp. AB-CW3 TaxID=2771012 RepID=UPI00168A40A5|nr:polysaccharide deacetylase family protein [Wenzhouxiangella sp. AB-CW3]QOC22008.1 polysaccharide deacetylase family protein [Wenzhouxiangella sp. AB-CW3]